MCFTAEDSLVAYIINLIASITLFKKTDDNQIKVISLFLLFVGQMQIFDFLFWKNQSCNNINFIVTKLAILFNHLQPVILFLLLEFYNFEHSKISLIVFIAYIIYKISYNAKSLKEINCTLPDNDVMDWKWNKLDNAKPFYALFLAYLTLAAFNLKDDKYKYLFAFKTLKALSG